MEERRGRAAPHLPVTGSNGNTRRTDEQLPRLSERQQQRPCDGRKSNHRGVALDDTEERRTADPRAMAAGIDYQQVDVVDLGPVRQCAPLRSALTRQGPRPTI